MADSGDYYPDMSGEDAAAEQPDKGMGADKEKSDYDTFLVPKSSLSGDPEPGMKETIEIVHVYEDEVECRCVGGEKGKSAMDEAGESLAKMANMTE